MSIGSEDLRPLCYRDRHGTVRFKSDNMLHDGVIVYCTAILDAVDEIAIRIEWIVEANFDPEEIKARYAKEGRVVPEEILGDFCNEQLHAITAQVSGFSFHADLREVRKIFETASSAAGNLAIARVRAALAVR